MRNLFRLALVTLVVAALLPCSVALAQPPGSWGGFRGGPPSGGFPGGGFPGGGFPGGGFRGSFPGGGFPGGGFPGGGFPGGGFPGSSFRGGDSRGGSPSFDPREMVRNADTNRNNMIDPDEFQSGIGRFLQRAVERGGASTNQALAVDRVIELMDQYRREREGYSSRSSSSSPYGSSSSGYVSSSSSTPAVSGLQSFGTTTLVTTPSGTTARPAVAMVPGFDAPIGAVGTAAATSTVPLEQRYDERVLERARSRMDEYDRDRNGVLEGEELSNNRWDPPWEQGDLNKDSKITLDEMAERYHQRYNGSSYGGSSGYSGGGYSGGYPGSSGYSGSSSSGYRPPFMTSGSPSMPMSSSSTSPGSSPTSSSSSSSSSDQARSFAERRLRDSDRNNNGKLERDEWQGTRITEESDTNKDGIITVEELTARMQSMMSGGGFRGPPGGFPGGGPPGGFPGGGPPGSWGDRGGSDRGSSDRDRGSDRDRDRGSDRDRDRRDSGESRGGDPRFSFSRGSDGRSGSDPRGGGDFRGGAPSFSPSNSTAPTAPKRSYRTSTPAERLPEGLPSWFARSDTSGDGQVSLAEFSPKLTEKDAQDFMRIDANGDGVITATECLASGPTAR